MNCWQFCVRFDRPKIWTSDLLLQKQTRYPSNNWPITWFNSIFNSEEIFKPPTLKKFLTIQEYIIMMVSKNFSSNVGSWVLQFSLKALHIVND